ncbi:uncharacterized protein GGS22DRAFT_37197 [Annulohypoxylon maeteangense]|uniref:uncharacterized protein n=1 Tax=Annulohypoxylon maeteangense TaxID=1927788 RepID=UPI002008E1C2|nr:uncharacterized protein GGS22DRAFT_37197 [Annulohypoxylon maeteangense]KAI0883201.1 hypothetical protein GGS22DRAFT_37197 [Annulohypoxylon maeteangense]
MSLPTIETQFRVSSDAAQSFVDTYYEARTRRRPLTNFYASTSARLTNASVKPDISINGLPVPDVAAYEVLLENQGGPVVYEISSFDALPVTPHYRLGEPEAAGAEYSARDATAGVRNGDRMSFMIQVSGIIRYTHEHTAPATAAGGPGEAKSTPPALGEAASATANTPFAVGSTPKPAEEAELPEQAFNEAFILVPHWEAWGRNPPRNLRKWVIVSQNFRTL